MPTRKPNMTPLKKEQKAVCPKLIERHPKQYRLAKAKLTHSTKSEAKNSAKKNDMTKLQKPYLCRYCGYWHNGKTTRLQNVRQEFILPLRSSPVVCDLLVADSPLAREIELIEFSRFYPENELQSSAVRKLLFKYSGNFTLSDLFIFTVESYAKAVVWALQNPPKQPVFLKEGDEITFRATVDSYWSC